MKVILLIAIFLGSTLSAHYPIKPRPTSGGPDSVEDEFPG